MSLSSRIASSVFQIASNEDDYELCDALAKNERQYRGILSFPTVMAFEDGELVGFLGTKIEKKMIIAGPLVLKSDRRRIFTALRLCEAYEMAMLNVGVSSFIFYIESDSLLDRALNRYYPSMKPYATRDGVAFYVWRMDSERRSKRTGALGGGASTPSLTGGASATAEVHDRAAERAE